jgi:phospholipid transport system substrate-binding protein
VGPTWRSLSDSDHRQLVDAFSAYSVATYAHEFARDSGVKFVVNPQTSAATQGGVVVHSQIVPSGGQPVPIDYLIREEGGQPRIIDIFLNGTISQLAARRSEYSATLRQGGAPALIAKLKDKTAELAK